MRKKHAFLLFTKAPIPGLTKTRLTTTHDGILTETEAAEFYKSCMLDVAEIGFQAISQLTSKTDIGNGAGPDQYDFVVCSSPASEQSFLEQIFEEAGPWPLPIIFINDCGNNFNEHFDNAFQQLFDRGYHSVVCIGGDLPSMPVSHLVRAFEWLDYFDSFSDRGGFVQAPCQACGVSLVGYSKNTPMDSAGVFYNLNGIPALDAYTNKAQERGVPSALLDAVADVDNVEDLAHTISLIQSISYSSIYQSELFVPHRTKEWILKTGIVISTPPNLLHDPRERIDA
ncbi:MAG: DUF2064 domain-containing protein [Anaerolineaceae bacterium]|nr:DUF2064 domain-containing protein [Anaerolineaceae bacterium]